MSSSVDYGAAVFFEDHQRPGGRFQKGRCIQLFHPKASVEDPHLLRCYLPVTLLELEAFNRSITVLLQKKVVTCHDLKVLSAFLRE